MEGRVVTNEKTGEKAWWDGKNLTPVKIEGDVSDADIAAGMSGQTAPMDPKVAAGLPPPPVEKPPAGVEKHSPRFPGVEKALQAAAGPVATGLAGLATGGASIPLQMGIGAATEAIGEKLGGQELDPAKIGIAAALPPVARGAGQLLKPLARGAAKVFGGENLIQGGVQKVEKTLGKEAADAAAETSLAAAKNVTVPAAQLETGKVVSEILKKKGRVAGTDPQAIQTAEEIVRNTVSAAKAGNPIRYNEVFEQAKNMRALATQAKGPHKENFIKLRAAMLDDLASISPEAGEAVRAYRRSAAIEDVADALKKPNPARWVREALDDPLTKGVFDKAQEQVVEVVARQIGNAGLLKIGGSLASLGAISAVNPAVGIASVAAPVIMGALVASPKIGAVMARSLVGPEGKINSAAIPALAQMVRGYLASLPQE